MTETLLPMFYSESTVINSLLAYEKRDGKIYYFHGLVPIFQHPEDDYSSFRLITSQLVVNGVCKQSEIVNTFGVSAISVKRWVKKYRENGASSFYKKKIEKQATDR